MREHFEEAVRDEDDRDFPLLERRHDLEQTVRCVLGERGGRLIEHQDRRIEGKRLGDLDKLAAGERQRFHSRPGIDVAASGASEEIAGALVHCAPSDERTTKRLSPEEEVFRHCEIGEETQLLIDGRDAKALRVRRIRDRDGCAGDPDLARVRTNDAREDIHQS